LKHADRITVPLLLIHGREDSTVPYERSATRLQMLQASMAFLEKYNPPD
jgi:dipeptidyl aminopeptidase/acylaminoacyl peptidase